MQFKTVPESDIADLNEQAQILLVTATNVETNAIHACLRPLHSRTHGKKVTIGRQTYYMGKLGGYGVIHVQCQMGSVLPGASGCTVAEALTQWKIKAVVMVGIAFGVDPKKQRIGDVLVSKTVIPYEVKRVGRGGKVIQRGPIPPSGATLLNRFSNGRNWTHPLARRQKAALIPTQLLSGESLIDDEVYRSKLIKTFPQAEGGEMEGAGVFAAAHQKNIEWILVKGICDFADGKKRRGKTAKQQTAAESAASLCTHVFSQPGELDALGCIELSSRPRQRNAGSMNLDEVLFEVYDQPYERAYLKRNIDVDIGAVLGHHGLWISGPAGCGKTNALRRNLSVNGKAFLFVDLSRCIGLSVAELFGNLHMELADALRATAPTIPATNKRNAQSFHIGQIARLIESNVEHETHIIIDEIPLDGAPFAAFVDGITAVIVTLANRNLHKAYFYLATINEPDATGNATKAKLHTHMQLLKMPLWSVTELTALLKQIAKLYPLNLTATEKARIVQAATGCPRSLKLILKAFCMHRDTPGWSLERVIAECPGIQHE